MNIEEKLQRLTERHEALAESVESLVATTKDNQQMIVGVAHSLEIFAREVREAIGTLIAVVRDHEIRIDSLEQRG